MKLPLCGINCAVIHFGSPHLSNYPLQPPYQIPTDICTIIAKYLHKTISENCIRLIRSRNQISGQNKTCKKWL